MSLISPSLKHVYCSILVSNHAIIRLISFVSRFTVYLCNAIYFFTTFSTPCKRFIKKLRFAFTHLNTAQVPILVVVFNSWTNHGPNMTSFFFLLFAPFLLQSQGQFRTTKVPPRFPVTARGCYHLWCWAQWRRRGRRSVTSLGHVWLKITSQFH